MSLLPQSASVFLPLGRAAYQRGAVLIVGLIMLAVLTLLGLAGMSATSLEEKMAANTQESTRAFQIAETGLANAFADELAWDLKGYDSNCKPVTLEDGSTVGQFNYRTSFNGWSNPPQLYSAVHFHAAHFDFRSKGETVVEGDGCAEGDGSGIFARHHAGVYQVAPKL